MPKGRSTRARRRPQKRVRYAVIGQGYFAQTAILPAFANAEESAELVALFSSDRAKLKTLRRRHQVPFALPYEEYEDFLASGEVDAVYIALPNHLHREYTVRAARAGIHVLCEKPMAVTSEECREMIRACEDNDVRLMVAYRLHFEEANLTAVEAARTREIGEPRAMTSLFSMQVRGGDIRTNPRELGGGPLYDIGIYCINAARYLFRAEPIEVSATLGRRGEKRFAEIEEQVSGILKFPEDRLAVFCAGYGSADHSDFQVVGTRGNLRLWPAYDFAADLTLELTRGGRTRSRTFGKSDQVAPEIVYFSSCILEGREPEPSGEEGLADVRVIEALYQAADNGERVTLQPIERARRPSRAQGMRKPARRPPALIGAEPPTRGG